MALPTAPIAPIAHLIGAGNTAFGRHEGRGPLDLMAEAAQQALDSAGLARADIDGVLCGYATTLPHLMLSTLFCEHFALRPQYAHGVQLGGATGAAMLMLARDLVRVGRCRNVLVVAGENRLTGQSRDAAIQTLAQVGDARFEVPNDASIPAYYALVASEYLARSGSVEEDLSAFAVLMRRHAQSHPDAHLRKPMSLIDAQAARPIATPLKLSDCCPISDGGCALIVSATPGAGRAVRIAGAGQAHYHQHVSAIADVFDTGAGMASRRALAEAGTQLDELDYLGIYDSFTITLMMLLEEIGIASRAGAARLLREGAFNADGRLALNTHGGLLSFGHSGVAGGMAHAVEASRQLSGRAGARQISPRRRALIHADGGVLSSHVSMVLHAD